MLESLHIKRLAAEAGFDLCGIARCRPFPENERRFRSWLAEGYNSSLDYLARNLDKRFDPARLVEGARTAVVCAVGYKNEASEGYPASCRTKIASYALTTDYHTTIRQMLRGMLGALRQRYHELQGRAFVDTAPLLEKQLAVEAGLGWIGRQSLLVTPTLGSFVLLGELLLTDEADSYDTPCTLEGCGRCNRCLESCPTGALIAPRTLDTGRCIACHTIEREPQRRIDLHGWLFGCDACQSCCPYNRRAPRHANKAFDPLFDPRAMTPGEWEALDERQFGERFGATPLQRSGLERIRRNARLNAADGAAENRAE